jgi:hypothetical protein
MLSFFRFTAIALPQILVLLWVGGSLDLLGGWNQTGDALGGRPAFFLIGLAMVLFIETLASNYYILTQVRM